MTQAKAMLTGQFAQGYDGSNNMCLDFELYNKSMTLYIQNMYIRLTT